MTRTTRTRHRTSVENEERSGAVSISRAAAPDSRPAGVLERYGQQLRDRPDALAVEEDGQRWSYRELDALALRISAALGGRAGPGDLVGVCLDRSVAAVASAVAIAQAGAVHLPVGPRPSAERLAAVAGQAHIACLITEPGPAGAVAGTTAGTTERIGLRDGGGILLTFPQRPEAAREAPKGAFYAVLTSGSTGVPKALAVGGDALAGLVDWYAQLTELGPGARQSLLVGVGFDPHLMEVWSALASGAGLVVAPDGARRDPAALTDWWCAAGVTAMTLPTPLAELVFERPWPAHSPLRHLLVGGDRLRRCPPHDVTAQVHNAYGPAEATVITTEIPLPRRAPGEAAPPDPPAIGHPVDGAVLCVVDTDGHPVPRGEPGELLIGGSGLALGYLDEALTRQRFTPPPAGLGDLDRVYHSGDRVMMRQDGVLEFLGRVDNQVKISGVRVEPTESEAALEREPQVRRAVVTAESVPHGADRLVAFVQCVPGLSAEATALRSAVRGRLPEQAVPSAIRFVDGFPLDAHDKVDIRALFATAERSSGHDGAPDETGSQGLSGTEQLVLRLCREILHEPALTLADDFMAAGGTSLGAATLLSSLEKASGVRLRVSDILRARPLGDLAAQLDARRDEQTPDGRRDEQTEGS